MSESTAQTQTCVVVGAGHAGSSLAMQLRKEGWTGRIVLLSEENQLPYHRPPLSKAVLAGDKHIADVLLRPEAMYAASGVELQLGVRVEAVARGARTASLSTGEVLHYDKLALCTGTTPRHLGTGDHLEGVFYLRTADDATRIRAAAAQGRRVVIIGGGYIGLEVAAVLATQGRDVTVLEAANRLLRRVATPVVSAYFEALHVSHGVRIVTSVAGAEVQGSTRSTGVRDAQGTVYPADLVIVGIGVLPATALAEAAGLEVENGIVVDACARTSDPHIYAAGDCTFHPSARYGKRMRLESVQNALDQARVAAANICGKNVIHDALPWFWSDQYDVKLQSAGMLNDHEHFVIRGDAANADGRGFSVFYLQGDHMVAADCINRAKEFVACKRLIAERIPLNVKALADEACGLDDFARRDD